MSSDSDCLSAQRGSAALQCHGLLHSNVSKLRNVIGTAVGVGHGVQLRIGVLCSLKNERTFRFCYYFTVSRLHENRNHNTCSHVLGFQYQGETNQSS